MRNKLFLTLFFNINFMFSQNLFDPYQVHTLEIDFYNSAYDSILQARWKLDDKSYELATIRFDGKALDSVGVRYKGNSTFWWARTVGSPKFPFNLDFNLIIDNQELSGYNKVKLSNSIFDVTFLRETIGYLTQSYYLPAPETGYLNVFVNGEPIGLYVGVESVNKSFLTKHFGNNQGAFFKCEPQFLYGEEDAYDAWPDLNWYGSDSTAYPYQKGYELKSETGWSDLLDLIYTLNYEIDSIATILNVDRVLWFFATSTVMPDLDAYNGWVIHNYYLYRNTNTGQFEIIPWDKDNTFGGSMINPIRDVGGDVSWIYNWDPFLFEYNDPNERPLFSKIMKVPLYRKLYTAHIRTIIEEIYNEDYLRELAYGIQNVIEPYATNDPNLFPSFHEDDYFRYNVDNYLITPDGAHWCGILPTVKERSEYLLKHREIAKTPPVIENVKQSMDKPFDSDPVIITAKVTNTNQVELMVSNDETHSPFISVTMFDDGKHGDGEENDMVFGATIPYSSNGSNIRYYVRASNNEALVLNPTKAEQEYYEYQVEAKFLLEENILINEINYNSSENFDPEDWVELYNKTEKTINISGWLFKDENDDHVFSIPTNTLLASNEYLVLTKDSLAFRTHFPNVNNYIGDLGFGLSGGGELIRLFDSKNNLRDFIEYNDSSPWPESADGNGPTLELIDPSYDNSLPKSWSASNGYGSPGTKNTISLNLPSPFPKASTFQILGNFPNPFNSSTVLNYELPFEEFVSVTIYDIIGRKIKTVFRGKQTPGFKAINWDGTNEKNQSISGGVYLCIIQAGNVVKSTKVLLLK